MKKAKGIKYLNKLFDKMIMHLERFIYSEDQEDLHKFRIQAKKLKAFLLQCSFQKNKNFRGFNSVKKVFRQAGLIREIYVHLQLMKPYLPQASDMVEEQNKLLSKAVKGFLKKGKKYIKKIEQVKIKIESELHRIPNKQIERHCHWLINNIVLNLAKRDFNKGMHECRKQIKILLYNQKIAGSDIKEMNSLNVFYLIKTQDLLGKWHDAVLAKELFSGEKLNDSLSENLEEEVRRLEKAVTSQTNNFWHKAVIRA